MGEQTYEYYEGEGVYVRHSGPKYGELAPTIGYHILRDDGTRDPWEPRTHSS